MLAASGRGHIRLVAALLDAGTNVDMMNPNGETPLWAAADHGQLEVMDLLISHGANVNLVGGHIGWSALHRAATAGQSDSVAYLLRHGANKDRRDAVNRTPLILAVMCQHVSCAAVLLQAGADPDVGTAPFGSPLNLAASLGNAPMVEVLIKYGASTDTAPFALHNAIDVDSELSVRILLWSGADSNVVDPEGRTPLTLAVYRGLQETVKDLLQHNANTELEIRFKIRHQYVKYTALELSIAAQQRLSTALLLMAGAETVTLLSYLDGTKLQLLCDEIIQRSPNPNEAADWLKWLTAYLQTPKHLSQLCRIVIRRSISRVCFLMSVKTLPLPVTLKNYISLTHIDTVTESMATEVMYS